jgi:hypothetical protein
MLVQLMKDCSFGLEGEQINVPKACLAGMKARGEIEERPPEKPKKKAKKKKKAE